MKKITGLLLLVGVLISGCQTTAPEINTVKLPDQERAQQVKDLKWGMFICWSFSTFSGQEWTPTLDKDASYFKATGCDTDQWARTAKEAGMGYILFLTKHHDGFCLWDTATTDKKVTNSPLGIDVLAKLRKSCDKYGIKLALYFSEGDWNWPEAVDGKGGKGGTNPEMKKAQLKELCTQYGPIEYYWMDHAVGDGGLSHEETVDWVHKFQPNCFVGFNHGPPAGRINLREMGRPGKIGDASATRYNKDAEAGHTGYLVAEFTYPILPHHKGGAQWFYSLPEHDDLCYPPEKLYSDYIGAMKYGNIFSIDVGPNYEGKLRDIDVETLRTVGKWIKSPDMAPQQDPPALSERKPATASSTWSQGYEADKAFDGDESTRWGAAPGSHNGWIQVDLGEDFEVGSAVIKEIGYHRTEAFAIECKEGEIWKELVRGTAIAGEKVFIFKPVVGRYFRLNIKEANEVPTIEEFQLYAPGIRLTTTEEKPRDTRLKWFDEAKYGLFINWGLYSIPAGEWKGEKIGGIGEWIMYRAKIPVKEYEQLAKQFNPEKFNAEEWAQLAEDAGMKYLVFDCKHHDGFALYHSEVSDYNCYDATSWKRDPMKELQKACKKRNIKLCFYYSQATDWHEPNGANNNWDFAANDKKDFDQYLKDKSMPQVAELLKNYGPIGLIWFDVPSLMTPERSKQLADLVHSIQPKTLINSRLGPGNLHDYRSMGDNEIPHKVIPGAWETAATINDTWGYKADDHNWKQPDNITFKLVDIVSKGGNYLLNVGPMGDGFIPQPSQDILRKVGRWLKLNGDSVYGAGPTPFGYELGSYDKEKKDSNGRAVFNQGTDWRCTVKPFDWTWGKPGKLYFHLFKWPVGNFEVTGIGGKIKKVYMLADNDRKMMHFELSADGKTFSVKMPDKAVDEIDSVLCVEVE